MGEVTRVLQHVSKGDSTAKDQLLSLVYDELRQMAAAKLAREKSGHSLEATALVHEAYLRFVAPNSGKVWENRGHFFAAAAEAMRRILIDQARSKLTAKRGGGQVRQALDEAHLASNWADEDLLHLDEALSKLVSLNLEAGEVVTLRFFAGLTHSQISEMLNLSEHTVRRRWIFARAWLRRELGETAQRSRLSNRDARGDEAIP